MPTWPVLVGEGVDERARHAQPDHVRGRGDHVDRPVGVAVLGERRDDVVGGGQGAVRVVAADGDHVRVVAGSARVLVDVLPSLPAAATTTMPCFQACSAAWASGSMV